MNKKWIAGFLFSVLGFQAHAGNVKCMPQVLEFVMSDFENARTTTGVVVKDRYLGEIHLGTDIQEQSVEISDISKNGYRVRIHLSIVGGFMSKNMLDTSVSIEDYETCKITTEKVIYRLF